MIAKVLISKKLNSGSVVTVEVESTASAEQAAKEAVKAIEIVKKSK